MRHFIPVAVAVVLALALAVQAQEKEKEKSAPAEPDAKKYEIRLSRPSKVGDKFQIEATGAMVSTTVVTIAGAEQKPVREHYGISVEGTIKVLEVSKEGAETKLSLTVQSCVAKVNEQDLPLLPAGTVLVAGWDKQNRKTAFTLNGKNLPDDVGELLSLVVNANDSESVSDDEIFGTKQKRQVGDSWPINADAAAKELGRIGLNVKPDDLYGESTLAEQVKAAGAPSLVIKTEFKARSFSTDAKGEEKVKIRTGALSIATSVTLPVDPALPPSKSSMTMKLSRELVGANEAGEEVGAVESSERQSERTIRPVSD